jgi:hypothetical protein
MQAKAGTLVRTGTRRAGMLACAAFAPSLAPRSDRHSKERRLDLTDAMAAGAAGGLTALLASLLAGLSMRPPASPRQAHALDGYALRTAQILLTLFAAAMLGALYWLSWGLAAVVNVAWWLRGIAFASVCWAALALPVLLLLRTQTMLEARVLAGAITQWLLICLGAGLACAWVAVRSP